MEAIEDIRRRRTGSKHKMLTQEHADTASMGGVEYLTITLNPKQGHNWDMSRLFAKALDKDTARMAQLEGIVKSLRTDVARLKFGDVSETRAQVGSLLRVLNGLSEVHHMKAPERNPHHYLCELGRCLAGASTSYRTCPASRWCCI
jgi:hypothetical protein